MHRILIAEDEPRIASFLEKGLCSHGFTTLPLLKMAMRLYSWFKRANLTY